MRVGGRVPTALPLVLEGQGLRDEAWSGWGLQGWWWDGLGVVEPGAERQGSVEAAPFRGSVQDLSSPLCWAQPGC